jgi:flagellar biosynthesis protein FlhF
MKYITIVAKDFEEAVRKAREQYGPALRIHSRRDVQGRGGFLWLGRRTHVELTCYLADTVTVETPSAEVKQEPQKDPQQEAPKEVESTPTEEPNEQISVEVAEEQQDSSETELQIAHEMLIGHAMELLRQNDFSSTFSGEIEELLRESLHDYGSDAPSMEEFELMLVDRIVSLVDIDHATQLSPPRIFVLLGPTGIGKTTTIAKIAALYGLQKEPEFRKRVRMITIDSFRAGAYEQLAAFGSSLQIPVDRVTNEEEFYRTLQESTENDLLLVDTIGKSPRDTDLAVKMKTLLSVPNREESGFFLALSGAMKTEDVRKAIDQYMSFDVQSLIVTKMDETETIGNILSVSHERSMPILFFTDGQRVPKDIHKASASSMLGLLRGFSLDFQNLWVNQFTGGLPVTEPDQG